MDRLLRVENPEGSHSVIWNDDAFERRTHGDVETVPSSGIHGCRLVYVIVNTTGDQSD